MQAGAVDRISDRPQRQEIRRGAARNPMETAEHIPLLLSVPRGTVRLPIRASCAPGRTDEPAGRRNRGDGGYGRRIDRRSVGVLRKRLLPVRRFVIPPNLPTPIIPALITHAEQRAASNQNLDRGRDHAEGDETRLVRLDNVDRPRHALSRVRACLP
jgi:hypothetical protein